MFPLTFSLILVWVIRVLLACYRYFVDRKAGRIEHRTRPIIFNNQTDDPSVHSRETPANGALTTVPLEDELSRQRFTAPSGFANENFTLSDEDDEHEDQLWPQKVNADAPPV
ncbi:unnamed protein product [Toxocara canis]|uniref:Uncharacterized protein n=1 Tax=Toxocara canis TaxID=6265 RepID=A0A3P7H208_TOXCA|nr:unnamed protein product [Toxocara canis]